MRTAHGYWKKQQQLQIWETKMFQLQLVQLYSQKMLKKERERNQEVFQM